MEISTMGKVTVAARIENLRDVLLAREGALAEDQIRAVEVSDALVDTGATYLSMPRRLIEQLGLTRFRTRTARTTAGPVEFDMHGAVQLTVEGRDSLVEAAEVPDDCPVLIGQIPLESLDFVVDPKGQELAGNPDHGGERMFDLF